MIKMNQFTTTFILFILLISKFVYYQYMSRFISYWYLLGNRYCSYILLTENFALKSHFTVLCLYLTYQNWYHISFYLSPSFIVIPFTRTSSNHISTTDTHIYLFSPFNYLNNIGLAVFFLFIFVKIYVMWVF